MEHGIPPLQQQTPAVETEKRLLELSLQDTPRRRAKMSHGCSEICSNLLRWFRSRGHISTMGLSFSRIWDRMFGKKEMRILMVGLDAAGKVLAIWQFSMLFYPNICRLDHHSLQAEAWWGCYHHSYHWYVVLYLSSKLRTNIWCRLQCRDCWVQEY